MTKTKAKDAQPQDHKAEPAAEAGKDRIGETIAKETAKQAAAEKEVPKATIEPAAAATAAEVHAKPAAQASQVELSKSFVYKDFAMKQRKGFTDLIFQLDGDMPDDYVKTLELPRKLVVDLLQTKPATKKWQAKLKHPFVDKIRIGVQPGNTLRLVIEFKKDTPPEFSIETPAGQHEVRVILKD